MKYLYVQFTGKPEATCIEADEVIHNTKNNENELIAKDAQGNIIGKFQLHSVAGWWTDDNPQKH